MTTKIFVAIRNLEMYKYIEFHTSVPKLQGDIQCSNNLYLIKALFVVPVLNCTEKVYYHTKKPAKTTAASLVSSKVTGV